jgi:hypothetical protein
MQDFLEEISVVEQSVSCIANAVRGVLQIMMEIPNNKSTFMQYAHFPVILFFTQGN